MTKRNKFVIAINFIIFFNKLKRITKFTKSKIRCCFNYKNYAAWVFSAVQRSEEIYRLPVQWSVLLQLKLEKNILTICILIEWYPCKPMAIGLFMISGPHIKRQNVVWLAAGHFIWVLGNLDFARNLEPLIVPFTGWIQKRADAWLIDIPMLLNETLIQTTN